MGAAAPNPGYTPGHTLLCHKVCKRHKGAALDLYSGRAQSAKPGKGLGPLTPQPDGSGRSNVRPDIRGAEHWLLTVQKIRFVLHIYCRTTPRRQVRSMSVEVLFFRLSVGYNNTAVKGIKGRYAAAGAPGRDRPIIRPLISEGFAARNL